jgi:hypothetical protein
MRPRAFGWIGPPHHPQVVAARRRSVGSAAAEVASALPAPALGAGFGDAAVRGC